MGFDPHEFDRSMGYSAQETLADYTAKTFLWVSLGLLITVAVALTTWISGLVFVVLRSQFILLIATLVLSFMMAARIHSMSVATARLCFLAFSVLYGLTFSVLFYVYQLPELVISLGATTLFFVMLSAYGRFTHTDLSSLGRLLFPGLIFLFLFGLITAFIPGLGGNRFLCIAGVAVFLGYVAYDTQMIRSYYSYYSGFPDLLEKAAIFSALQLYLDFINLFLYLLRYLSRRKD